MAAGRWGKRRGKQTIGFPLAAFFFAPIVDDLPLGHAPTPRDPSRSPRHIGLVEGMAAPEILWPQAAAEAPFEAANADLKVILMPSGLPRKHAPWAGRALCQIRNQHRASFREQHLSGLSFRRSFAHPCFRYLTLGQPLKALPGSAPLGLKAGSRVRWVGEKP
jgi:hypothetical protein